MMVSVLYGMPSPDSRTPYIIGAFADRDEADRVARTFGDWHFVLVVDRVIHDQDSPRDDAHALLTPLSPPDARRARILKNIGNRRPERVRGEVSR
jgi:hypothetical protein